MDKMHIPIYGIDTISKCSNHPCYHIGRSEIIIRIQNANHITCSQLDAFIHRIINAVIFF